jgi:hypothetical protein
MRMRWIRVAVVIATCIATAVGGNKEATLRSRLEADLLKKSFRTKIRLGNYVTYYHSGLGRNCNRLIDTEFSPNGTIQYQARKGCFSTTGGIEGDLFSPNFYVDPSKITRAMPEGTNVWVGKIDVKDNRIEVWLTSTVNAATIDSYAKIKFMLGNGYQNWEYETLIGVLSRALYIEAYERIATLNAQYERLQTQLASAETRYQAAAGLSATVKLDAARDLSNTLRHIIENRSAYISTGRSDTNSPRYTDRASALDTEIAKLETESRRERAQQARAQLLVSNSQAAKLKTLLQGKPSTLADWQHLSQTLDEYRRLLYEQQTLHQAIAGSGDTVSPTELAQLQQDFRDAEAMGQSLSRDRQQLQVAQLNAEYRELERKRIQLLDSYTKAFGSAQERPALQALIAHLERMYDNRMSAQQLGNTAASSQAVHLRSEIDKFKKR